MTGVRLNKVEPSWALVDLLSNITSPDHPVAVATYRDHDPRPRPFARFALLAAYEPADLLPGVHSNPGKATVCYRHEGGPWVMGELPEGVHFGRFTAENRALEMPAIAVPTGRGLTEGVLVVNANSLLAPFCLYTAGVTRAGEFVHRTNERGLSVEELQAIGAGDVPIVTGVDEASDRG